MTLQNQMHLSGQTRSAAWMLAVFILLALLAVSCSSASPSGSPQPDITLKPCLLSSPSLLYELQAECGSLRVYEDPDAGTGREIELKIVVVPAISRSPEPDPIFFLAGGPGQAASETFPLISTAFQAAKQKRDIILVDQRGTGGSAPLHCPAMENMETEDPDEAELEAVLEKCLAEIDADPALYTTSTAAADLDAVRLALGYEKINLYGVSYGTRMALTYLQQYPEHVRSVTLDGVVPQDEALGLDVARDAQRALDLIFARCAADPDCSQAFPGIDTEFQELLRRLEAEPVELHLPHPSRGENVELTFTAEMLANTVRLLSYSPETAALLPLLIHAGYADGRVDLLAAQYLIVSADLSASIATVLGYSVLCAEDTPYMTPEQAEQANTGTYLANSQTDALFQVCEIWPRGEVPGGFKEPVRSDVPVLILSGELDPVTPPENGTTAAQTLPNSLHIVLPGQGHNVVYRGCTPAIFSDFVEAGSVQGLDVTCASQTASMPFFTSFSGY